MRTRLLSTLALITLALFGFASSANAQQPIPSIKATPEFHQLKNYVNFLQGRREKPASNALKGTYKVTLKTRRTSANNKSKALLGRRIVRISKRDDKSQRRAIKSIRHNQSVKVARLNATLSSRLAKLNAKQNVAVDRVNAKYALRIDPLTRKRAILQKRLGKTTNPVKRNKIAAKITAVQRQINAFVNSRQAAANAVVAKYNARAFTVKDLFAARISNAKVAAKRQIKVANNAFKQLFRGLIRTANQRKTAEIALITALNDRGLGYIVQMPNIDV